MAKEELDRLSALLREHNRIGEQISTLIGRPALTGHLGEFIASKVFDVKLESSATKAGIDGHFMTGPLTGRSVNVKCYLKLETLDINPRYLPDYYLVLTGPRSKAAHSRGASRPFVISHVFLFETEALCAGLSARGVKLQTGTSLRRDIWDAGEIFPESNNELYQISDAQRSTLALFAPDA
ncbi:MAG TPA: hypothetical protein VJ865_02815 [Gemmatimonadaceae bacterium]|nr:hypothetical protein [Gemmatimonadaceae bacterium]